MDSLLAGLRRLGRHHSIDAKNSLQYGAAAHALSALRHACEVGHALPVEERAVVRRVQCLADGVLLQRSLEIKHKVPHRRRLKDMVKIAESSGQFSHGTVGAMNATVQKSNAARHMKWQSEVRQTEVDSRFSASNVFTTRNKSCQQIDIEIMLDKLGQMIAQMKNFPVPRRPPGVFFASKNPNVEYAPHAEQPRDSEQSFEQGLAERLDMALQKGCGSPSDKFEMSESVDKLVDNVSNPFMQLDTHSHVVAESASSTATLEPVIDNLVNGGKIDSAHTIDPKPKFSANDLVVTVKSVGDYIGTITKVKYCTPASQWAYLIDTDLPGGKGMWFQQKELQKLC